MAVVTVGHENSAPIRLYYEDLGCGSPVVLIHGCLIASQAWERQVTALLQEGHRIIMYDRRGSARSSGPLCGYDWQTFSDDLDILLTTLDVRQAVLVGHSIGTGEIMRYLRVRGSKRISRAALIAPVDPSLKPRDYGDRRAHGNGSTPTDRYATLARVVADYYNLDVYLGTRVSSEVVQRTWDISAAASPMVPDLVALARATDFSLDAGSIDVPVLVITAGADRILPESGGRQFDMLPRSKQIVISNAPHGLLWTHADEVNRALLEFIDA